VVPIGGFVGIMLYPSLDIFGLNLPALVEPNREAATRVFYWHMLGALAIVLLASLHVVAAAYHYYIRKDGVLRRMWLSVDRFST
jgi:cytochrome b561